METRLFGTTPVAAWEGRFPWLRAGTTRRTDIAGSRAEAAGPSAPGEKPDDVDLTLAASWRAVVRSRQVHGRAVRVHGAMPRGVSVTGEADGHATGASGVLLTVTLADCVPVFIVDPSRRTVALLHAGWRGTAAGVVEAGLDTLSEVFASDPAELLVHLGPAICGRCYEVGPEVFRALGEAVPVDPGPIDLRSVIRRQTIAAGVRREHVTVSDECTLCGDGRYFSHRRGDCGRHRGYIGIRESDDL
ncbi:MAG: polyphenol oxidase family protein [Gemmatimonadetes bacterium]|nr:polyphenol oxidase family protein [Gemmatimonadota bacterium]